MFAFLTNLCSLCGLQSILSLIGGAFVLYHIIGWLFRPKLKDSYFKVDESKFYELEFVGKHSSEISLDDIPKCIEEMRTVYNSNITRSISSRKKQLQNLLLLLEENEDKIIAAIDEDLGRCSLMASLYEVYPIIGEIKKFLKNISSWSAPQRMSPSLLTFPSSDYHIIEPYGTVYINGIWNFPFQLALSPIAGAIAAGNNVIFKPCNTANASSKLLCDLLHKYMDHKFVQCVGGPQIANGDDYVITNKILENGKFDLIFFTGSSNGGRYFMEKASKYLTPVILELGGKNPVIIDDTADLELAAKQILNARMINAGQQCISPDYILCYKSCLDEFIEKLLKYISLWYKIGDSQIEDLAANQAKLINLKQLKRVQKLLSVTNGEIIYGGKCNEKTLMFEPTIVKLSNISDISNEETMKHETFGPILWIVPINNNIDEAINYINEEQEKSLSLYLFSKNLKNQNAVKYRTSSGGLQINGTLTYAAHCESRFGGIGESGIGSYHGKHSFDAFSHYKPCIQTYVEVPFVYPPYTGDWKKKLFKMVF